jgi:hypothetical protein
LEGEAGARCGARRVGYFTSFTPVTASRFL